MQKCENEKLSIAPHQKSAWFGFIKVLLPLCALNCFKILILIPQSLATFKGDLASLTAPPFLLSPQSMIEFSAYWAETSSLFIAPALEPNPEQRALKVLKWFLSTLKEQHSNKDAEGKKKKLKPLNPFLGELFLAEWKGENGEGTTKLAAEQVSHHPPVTACNLWNEEHGIRVCFPFTFNTHEFVLICLVKLQGNVAPKVYFSSTVHIDRKGYSLLHIDKYDEDYLITMPKIHVEGLMTGSLFPELSGTSYIRSSSGYTAKIIYSARGWLSGKRNSFTASLNHDDNPKEALYVCEGQWSESYTIKDMRTKDVIEEVDVNAIPKTPLTVAPVEKQHPLESRRAWQYVADAINRGDMFGVGHEKSKIENQQREMRKIEKSEETEFPRKYFSKVEKDVLAERLCEGMKGSDVKGLRDGHEGVWRWDEEKYWRVLSNALNGVKSPTRRRFDSGVGGIVLDENGESV
jgi:hypothetical protein